MESLLTTYADDLGEPDWDEYYGHGRINVFKSLVGPMPVVLGYYAANEPKGSTPTNFDILGQPV